MSKTFWAVIAAIVVVFGAIIVFNKDGSDTGTGGSTNGAQATNHTVGEGKAGVTLVEYGDFQCSACYRYEPTLQQVIAKYKTDVTFQFRHLPLIQVHQNALASSRAAEAAGLQGKFWEMHDLLYENQPTWEGSDQAQKFFEQYAKQLGLNVEQYKKDAASSKVNNIINADIAEFKKTGATMSTPTFFLNGKKVTLTPDINSFTEILDKAIADSKKEP